MTDPNGDGLAFASAPELVVNRYLPPYPLIAAMADAQHAAKMALPAEVRDAVSANDYARFLNRSKDAPVRVYSLAIEQAWKEEEWTLVERWSREAIRLAPRNAPLKHNLAVVLSNDPRTMPEAIALLRQALAQDENYGRAHLTLASCLLDTGQRDEARVHAEWVRDHDGQLKRDAEEILARIPK
ncbi:MAG TPA: tetratricopeptide repeat protein [Thermoanaerobaculia bacterium]|nr:tetratricopeptide repeat protein [Thermoanaerobaculia bacterium]